MALGILTQFLRGGRVVPRTGIKILTSKRGPRNYYKGKGCKSTGRHTSKGGYVLMDEKLPKYIVPDLTNCKFLPYVAHDTPKLAVAKEKKRQESKIEQIKLDRQAMKMWEDLLQKMDNKKGATT